MCGICGVVHADPRAPVDRDLVKRMTAVLTHRGPDEEGLHLGAGVGLGHRRLAVIDLNSGREPIFNEDRSLAIVFNGEVYNFLDLRPHLRRRGHRFSTRTDAEVVLHLYEEEGADCVERLRGMFAFAIWDGRHRTLFLARDRLGKKPLYYYLDGQRILFASEIKSLLQDPTVSRDIDPEAVDLFFTYLYVPSPWSIFRAVRKLPPASVLLWREGKVRIRRYWDVRFEPRVDSSPERLARDLRRHLTEAVRIRLISDVPLGAFLSGGLDSSLVVALMSQVSERPVVTNSVGFTESAYDERDYARMVAHRYRTEHHEFVVDPKAVEVVEELSWFYDEPYADSSAVPTYYAARMARETVTVALSGDGGDENFAGYAHRYRLHRLESRLRRVLPRYLRRVFFGPLAFLWPKGDWLPQPLRWKYLLQNLTLTDERAFFNDMSTFRQQHKMRLYQPDFLAELGGFDAFVYLADLFASADAPDPLSRALYVDLHSYLVEDGLTKVDRASSAHGLEVRCPLLDHRLVEFAATIPSHLKLRGRTTKWILKHAARDLLPQPIIERGKWGFRLPVERWLRNELREMVEVVLLGPNNGLGNFLRPEAVEGLWRQHLRGLRDNTGPLWAMLMFGLWYRRFASGVPRT